MARDRGYDDRDDYSSTVDAAAASAAYHALPTGLDDDRLTRAEIVAEERAEERAEAKRRGWRR